MNVGEKLKLHERLARHGLAHHEGLLVVDIMKINID
jgi:hypothetical protein